MIWCGLDHYRIEAKLGEGAKPSDERPLAVHVVHNWFEEFRGKRDTL